MPPLFEEVRQIGFMSRDIDASMRYFVDAWGVGPWYVLRKIPAPMIYGGQPTDPVVSIAMANCGELQFEIVQQHNDAPSLYVDALAKTPSLHVQHVAVWVDDVPDLAAKAAEKGWQAVFETAGGPGKSVFITHPAEPAVCIELSDRDPFKVRVREAIKAKSVDWDGSDPIRDGLPAV